MKRKHILLLTFVVWMIPSTILANTVGPHHDSFNATLQGDNQLNIGGGTGWNNGAWTYYDQTDWWNQWFYDDPPNENRMKHIDYSINISSHGPEFAPTESEILVEIALNWSTMDYPATGPDGQPPMPPEEVFIERHVILPQTALDPGQAIHIEGPYDILDFNPEWVSIDVRVYSWSTDRNGVDGGAELTDPVASIPVEISGEIIHECIIPEPATLILMGLGGLLLRRKYSPLRGV